MIKNLIPYYIDETNGNLIQYNDNIKINIKGQYYSYDSDPVNFHKIETKHRLKYTKETNIKLKDKYVVVLRKLNNNNDELCVKLNLYQYIRVFVSLNFSLSDIFKILNQILKTILQK